MKIDLIIPVHNIWKRGFERVRHSLNSLSLQGKELGTVWVMDGGTHGHAEIISDICRGFTFVKHIHMPQEVFNKPKLLNEAIRLSDADYIIASDCDYIFRNDFITQYALKCRPDTMLLKEVHMLPNMNISYQQIAKWNFKGKYRVNQYGKLANGAAQCASKEWFVENPYNEEMYKLGGMDNLAVHIAEKKGMNIIWVEESVILHQHHPISTYKMDKQFKRNQEIITAELNKLKGNG